MLGSEVRREPPSHLCRHRRNQRVDGQGSIHDPDQPRTKEVGEVSGQPHLLPLACSAHQAKQFSDGAGAKSGHPESAHIAIGRLDPLGHFIEADRDDGANTRRGPERGTCMPRGAIDRRTILATCRCPSGNYPFSV